MREMLSRLQGGYSATCYNTYTHAIGQMRLYALISSQPDEWIGMAGGVSCFA